MIRRQINRVIDRIMRRHDLRIAHSTLDWWDFDGSFNTDEAVEDEGEDAWIRFIQRR